MSEVLRAAAAAQRAAADPEANVFVTANAGSGKTKVLVDRIARLLLTGAAPNSFLCITYTKAAAAEMQRRLFERLGRWCVMPDAELAVELGEIAGAPLQDPPIAVARALFARALEAPGGLKIQTIHAFCERLLRRFPLESCIAPGFEIADDSRAAQIKAQAWRKLWGRGQAELDTALLHLSARFDADSLSAVQAALLARRAMAGRSLGPDLTEFLHGLVQRHGERDSREDILAQTMAEVDPTAFSTWLEPLRAGGATDQALAQALERLAEALDDEDAFATYAEAFLTGEFAIPARAPPTQAVQKRAPWMKEKAQQHAEKAYAAIKRLRAASLRDDTAALALVARALTQAYHARKAEIGAVDFEDLITGAVDLLCRSESAGWVLFKLDGGIEHILIDEGQDTSPDQWRLIAPLQDEFFAGHGRVRDPAAAARTVFAVGDPKQSIYGFQGADPEGFLAQARALQARATGAGRAFVAPVLAMSFRSAPEVLAAVDASFANEDVGADAPSLFDRMTHTAHRSMETGLVEWWPLTPAPKTEIADPWDAPLDRVRADAAHVVLARALAEQVRQWIDERQGVWERGVLRPMRPGDVLALVRSRGPMFQQLLKAFKGVGLPVAGADRMRLTDEISVQDLLALARLGLDPDDDLSLACVLKGPFVGLVDDDVDLGPLAMGRAPGETLMARLRAAPDRYHAAQAFVEGVIARADHHPHRFFAAVLEDLDERGVSGWARMLARLGEAARDPVEEFMARALNAGGLGAASLHAFVNMIENDAAELKRQQDDAGETIAVMTVHAAKGLERPLVILPQTADAPKASPDYGLVVTREHFALLGAKDHDDAYAEAVRTDLARAADAEHLRLLYVAMTRARDRLIVCGHANAKNAPAAAGSWHVRVGAALEKIGAPFETPFGQGYRLGARQVAKTEVAAAHTRQASPPYWTQRPAPPAPHSQRPAPSGRVGASPRAGMRARLARGRLIHGLLQRLPDVAATARRAAGLAWLQRQPTLGDMPGEAILEEALAILEDARFAPVFGPGSRAEAPIFATLPDGRTINGVVDRVLVRPDACLVIDFKTDRPPPQDITGAPERMLRQMADYRAALRAILPGRPVRAALIWTLAARLDEIPDALLDRLTGC
jgi:ATP-dependent helicase/nuclease subunit A